MSREETQGKKDIYDRTERRGKIGHMTKGRGVMRRGNKERADR